MNPTKYCNCIQCSDCSGYTDCLEYEIETLETQGKFFVSETKHGNLNFLREYKEESS